MIQVENLTKFYEKFCAVDKITLNVKKGEIIGLLGPNGAGKTTTLRMLTGFFKASSGTIIINGHDITEDVIGVKKSIGYLPESAPLYEDMLVFDYLNYIADLRDLSADKKRSRIKHLVSLCSINDIMHKPIGELSKGLKQRVGLAHAMMDDPEILILDEPTSGLDPNQIVEIRRIIREIGKEKTIIFSTHILSEAEATCDRIVIINNGKIVADGTTDEIRHSAKGENALELTLKNCPFSSFKTELESIKGIVSIHHLDELIPGETRIQIQCDHGSDIREAVYSVIKTKDWILLKFQLHAHSLENIFRNLTTEN